MRTFQVKMANKAWAERFGDPVLAELQASDSTYAREKAMRIPRVQKAVAGGQRIDIVEVPTAKERKVNGERVPRQSRKKRMFHNLLDEQQGGVP